MLEQYVELLKKGDVVAFPTETVYGLGADAWNPSAIRKVFEIKGRPADNPLIVHISDIRSAADFADEISDEAQKLMEVFWPGPLTLVLPKRPEVLDSITGGLQTVALRWPRHPLSQQLIARAGPLVAPSANSSGRPSPTKPEHVKEDFGEDFPVLEAGETDIGLESTVLDITVKPFKIYRPGVISAEEIEKAVGEKVEMVSKPTEDTAAKSPGTKYSHYSPNAVVGWLGEEPTDKSALYLLHSKKPEKTGTNTVHYHRDYRRMARELYDRFREADHLNLKAVLIEPFTDEQMRQSVVQALQNRISKAIG